MIINVIIVCCFIPAYKPDINYDIYYNMPVRNMWSYLFYSFPWMYIVLKIFLVFLISGGIATLSLSISLIVRNRFAILILPIIFFVILDYIKTPLGILKEISPTTFLYGGSLYEVNMFLVISETFIIVAIPFIIFLLKGRKHDIL